MSDKSDYNFMKTGTSNLVEPLVSNEEIIHIGGILMAFMSNAIKHSDTYVHHAGRGGITPTDIKYALQYEIFEFTTRKDTPKNIQDMVEWLKNDRIEHPDEYYDTGEEADNESLEYSDSIEEDDEVIDDFAESVCDCLLCNKINVTNQLWKHWVPTTKMEEILKDAINNI